MTYRVLHYNPHAVTVPFWRDLRGTKMPMPADWAFLVDCETEIPHRETTIFLGHVGKQSARKRRRRRAGNTAYTYAGELKPYLEYLQWLEIGWDEADQEVLFNYIDRLCERRHWFTGEGLDPTTLDRRVRRVIQAYVYTNKKKISDVDLDSEDLLAELWEALDAENEDAVAGERRNAIRFIDDADWALIAQALGPLPSELPERDPDAAAEPKRAPTGRNRLFAEIGVTTGMRGGELAGMPLAPFLTVEVTDANRNGWTKILLSDTKGGYERPVFVANALVREIQLYASRGRAAAVAAGAANGNADPGTVFVNGTDSGSTAGRAMRAQQLSVIFREAVRAVLPTEGISIVDEAGERLYARPKFRLHDLRHTFALRLFSKLTDKGKEPWDIIQGRLGHRKVETTRAIYLDVSRTSEPYAADLVAAGMDALIYG
ncbi:site-specific integrase [Sphingomonas sp. ZB1N12]|uniref:tyrosine-type recombinase/integrase n=1 Tax=Sphingomonas arabinosi TaxID=3096160 RepID=UPI002FC970A1